MKKLQNFLNIIDILYQKLQKKEQIMIYILVISILSAFTYFTVVSMDSKKINLLNNKKEKILKIIKNNNKTITNNDEEKLLLKEIERTNNSIQEQINNNKEALKYIKKKIKEQHNIKFSSNEWGEFYENIQRKAIKHNIKILNIKNKVQNIIIPKNLKPAEQKKYLKKQENEFRSIYKINIEATTKFNDLLNFLLDIEKNKLLTKISYISVKNNGPKSLETKIEINLWGIKK